MRYNPDNMTKAVETYYIKFIIHNQYPLNSVRSSVLSKEEERLIAKTLGTVSVWGFPTTHSDIRQVVAKFVARQDRNIPE